MVRVRQVSARRRTLCFLVFVVLFVGLARGSSTCRGKQNYKLDINMAWDETDGIFRNDKSSVGGVLAVAHNAKFKLFELDAPLREQLKRLIQENNLGPARSMLERLAGNPAGDVASFDYVTGAKHNSVIRMNVELDGDRGGGCTYVTIMGNLLGTPDFFFGTGTPINLCNTNEGNFTKRYPTQGEEKWVNGFDAGIDGRTQPVSAEEKKNPTTDTGKVTNDRRPSLQHPNIYANIRFVQGRYENKFAFWKILVIVGVLSIALLVAFICLYPVCCKKQMLDVPVPLQDESQWAT